MAIVQWPVADWRRIVRAYRPGRASVREGVLRTLMRHQCASGGVRIACRAAGSFNRQINVFSSLNVDAARLARCGDRGAAIRMAHAAAAVEAEAEFAELRRVLSQLSGDAAQRVLDGTLPHDAPHGLTLALTAVARRTQQARADEARLATADVVAGRITSVREGYVVLAGPHGPATLPRWVAEAAHRDAVGALLVLVSCRLEGAAAIIEAVPALDVEDAPAFSPYGRDEPRTRAVTLADEALLAGEPAPLHILARVKIES